MNESILIVKYLTTDTNGTFIYDAVKNYFWWKMITFKNLALYGKNGASKAKSFSFLDQK